MPPCRWSRKRRGKAVAAVLGLVPALIVMWSPRSAWGESVRLRNELSAGVLSVYAVTVETTRTIPATADKPGEVLSYTQAGRLTLLVLSSPQGGAVQRAWMIELDEGRIDRLTRSGRAVAAVDLPESVELGLPPRAAQLTVDAVTPIHAPAHAAGGSVVQRGVFLLALDVAHWPERPVKPSATWKHRLDCGFGEVTRIWTLEEVVGQGRTRRAVVTTTARGDLPGGSPRGPAEIGRADTRFVWHVSEHSVISLTAEVELTYRADDRPRRVESKMTVERVSRRKLSDGQRESAVQQLDELLSVVEGYRRGDRASVVEALQAFEASYPGSVWLPVARDLRHKAKYELQKLETLSGDELRGVLIQLLARWQRVVLQGDPEPLEPLRRTLGDLARAQARELEELARHEEANLRALAVFCLAFGGEEGIGLVLSACGDSEATVRAWAVYGLAERGEPLRDVVLLERALGDASPQVRQRACAAVEACVSPDSSDRGRFAGLLLDLARADPVKEVRAAAAGALLDLADKADLPALRRAAEQAEDAKVRQRLRRVIDRWEGSLSRQG